MLGRHGLEPTNGVASATSATDGGHPSPAYPTSSCEEAVNLDGTYNLEYLNDWGRVSLIEEVLLSKQAARNYYGTAPKYNYWNDIDVVPVIDVGEAVQIAQSSLAWARSSSKD